MNFLNHAKNIVVHFLHMLLKEKDSQDPRISNYIASLIIEIRSKKTVKDILAKLKSEIDFFSKNEFDGSDLCRGYFYSAFIEVHNYASSVNTREIIDSINKFITDYKLQNLIEKRKKDFSISKGIIDFQENVYEEFCSLNSKAITKNEDTEYYRFLMYINDAMLRNGFSGKGGVDSILKKQNKKYKNLTFLGGGAKGVVYVGAIKALEELHVLDCIKKVSGSSIGALTALFVSLGFPAGSIGLFYKRFFNENFTKIFGEGAFSKKNDKWAQVLQEFFNEMSKIKDPKYTPMINFFGVDDIESLIFGGLHIFHMNSPYKVKELFVTGVDVKNEFLNIFSYENTPQVKVIDAVVASMSFPGMVCPKKIGEREYMDGGYVNNIPSNIFDHYYDDQVLVVGFENENMKKLVYSENPVFSKGSLK